ncbi:MAG: CDP-alcohol phosphatidyltransferase family protein [Candidatus Uhrbacteria bacterium]|nr:CDP-alcohol phosphatidyltransferase family protein [Candidatus Uhrbacteria bacterium]
MAQFFDQHVARSVVTVFPRWLHPNHLSIIRAAFVVPVIYWRDQPSIAVSALILSSVFDMFDGPLARLRKQVSQTGATLDATADKIFVLGVLFFACGDRVALNIRITVAALDFVLTLMRPLKRRFGVTTNSNIWGAWKTWVQSFALAFVLTRNSFFEAAAPYVFSAAICLACLSLAGHLRDFRRNDIAS